VVCATYVLVQNILAFIFSCVLIDFDRRYITNPCYDYSSIISTISSSYGINYIVGCLTDTTSYAGKNFWPISISLAKGQLAGAVLILVTSLIYVGIYIYVYIRSLYDDGKMQNNQFVSDSQRGQQQSTIYVPTPIRTRNVQVPPPIYTSEPSIDYTPKTIRRNDFNQSVICHRCGTVVYTDERRGQQQTTIYVATSIRTRNAQVPPSIYTAEPSVDYSPRAMRRNDFIQSVICHRCGAVVYTDERF
jgi:ribosomal protein L37E